MNTLGWVALDNKANKWHDQDFPEYPGGPTAWSQLISVLEAHDRYLFSLTLRHKTDYFYMPVLAKQYALHYDLEVEFAGSGQQTKRFIVATAIKDPVFATVRDVDEDGNTTVRHVPIKDLKLMRPSPLAPD